MSPVMAVPLLVSAMLGLGARRLVRWLPPATAVRLLTAGTLATALSTGLVLGVCAFTALAQVPAVARVGRWSTRALAEGVPWAPVVGAACGAVVLVLLASGLRRGLSSAADLVAAEVACRRLGPGAHGLVVVHDDHPDAYALPGLGGRVVVSTAMLRALPADERRVLLAHEDAHLRCRHHAYIQLADLATAANPLLAPVSHAVRSGIERWADEAAATRVGDRALAARALARASIAQHQSPAPRARGLRAALAATDSAVVTRTQALLEAAPRPRRVLAAATAALILAGVAAAAVTAHDTEHRFEAAQVAFTHTR